MSGLKTLERDFRGELAPILRKTLIIFGFSYLLWLVFYFDFLKKSLASVASLIVPSARVLFPLTSFGVILVVCLLVAIFTRKVTNRAFTSGLVITGVLLGVSSIVSIGFKSYLAWVSLGLSAIALISAWKLPTARLFTTLFLTGVLVTSYVTADQAYWIWDNRPKTEPVLQSIPESGNQSLMPSVYVVLMDEMSLSLVNHYTSFMSLPNLSRLAREGIFFPRAYGISDDSAYSIGALFTGKYLEQELASGTPTDAWLTKHRNLVTDLVNQGYQIKVYNDFFAMRARFSSPPLKVESDSREPVTFKKLIVFTGKQLLRQMTFGLYHSPNIGALLQGQSTRIFDLEHNPEKPQFVYIHLLDAHHEYLRNRDGSFHHNPYTSFDPYHEATDRNNQVADNYFEQILWADSLAGQLVDQLLAIPAEQRIVVFVSDHGISWREPPFGRVTGYLNTTQVQVPAVMIAPDLLPGIDPQLLPLIDLYPTIIDLVNKKAGQQVIPPPAGIDGLSLLAGNEARETRTFYAFSDTNKYKLQGSSWILDAQLKDGIPGSSAPIPAQELSLTSSAAQMAIESAKVRPIPPMSPWRGHSAPYASAQQPKNDGTETIIERFLGYELIRDGDNFYGIREGDGPWNLDKFLSGLYRGAVDGMSIEEVKQKIVEKGVGSVFVAAYKEYIIIYEECKYYGILQADGTWSLEWYRAGGFNKSVEGASLEEVKSKIDAYTPPPTDSELVEEGYYGYNVIREGDRYYGILQVDGAWRLEAYRGGDYRNAVEGASLEEVKSKIDEAVNR